MSIEYNVVLFCGFVIPADAIRGLDPSDDDPSLYDLAYKLAAQVRGCEWGIWESPGNEVACVIGAPFLIDNDHSVDDGPFSCCGTVTLATLEALRPELERIRLALVGLGFDPGEARVAPVWTVG